MTKVIPNQNSWIGFATSIANLAAPAPTEVASAVNLTPYVIQITAQAQGNTVPTPTLDSLFETSVPGTSTAQFTADFYRDDIDDLAWNTLPRGTSGYVIISRFGGTGTEFSPAAGQGCEVWPVQIVSRSMSQMASNTAETFTVTAAVPTQPVENAAVS